MAVARFQILSVLGDARSGVTWRFLSANNRKLGRSAVLFADAEACGAAVRDLRDQVGRLAVVMMRDGPRRWAWRIRLADRELAMSSRSYERWVEAHKASALFLDQVAQVPKTQQPQVVQF